MSPEKRKAAQSKGGKSTQARGKAPRFTALQARIAGRRGGKKTSANVEHMKEIGRIGGHMKAAKRKISKAFEEVRLIKQLLNSRKP